MTPEQEADFSRFVVAESDRLGRFAFLLCGDWHRAEDAVQRAFAKLYPVWGGRAINTPRAYIRRMIVNVVTDDYRLCWFRKVRLGEPPPDTAGFDPTQDSATRVLVRQALSRLPRGQRTAVVLRYWEDLPVARVAEIMGCTPGAVKSQSSRGLRTMREVLRAQLREEPIMSASR
ncbi:MAG TPA: SigE family RNA polymerase sigma factor [Stackebrandtia sp.]|jgi:RNA polymerase sigma-70 factor (sigma-E family)|uniref:SigE family RNA polymerase sigma factor n=1 Tax=Stackebrandtia sp. TaxID=2023065 RepID=UPI002D707625|nr:SigE family RNA polymerase sigma factor [Stackebrandtia sp.]HZE41411.1 SigE family RNA polymerase sigma factor [Stackebrandtia sp.]